MTSLSVAELCYMLRVLPMEPLTRQACERVTVDLTYRLTTEQIDGMRDLCADRLQIVGFDESYEPTEEGRLLESLLDKLYQG